MPSWLDKLTPDERQAHFQKMQAGRQKARTEKAGELVTPPASATSAIDALATMNWQGRSEPELRQIITIIDRAKEAAGTQLRILVDKRTGERCGNPKCTNPLPANGRHFGELSWHDFQTQSIRVLRACSPGCYAQIQAVAEGIKRGALEAQHSAVSHN